MTLIKIDKLDFGYESQLLFRNFTFESRSDRILVRGASGCGKTTLLKIVDGIIETAAIIERPRPSFLVLQSDGLAPWLTGRQNISLFSSALWERVAQLPLFSLIADFCDRPVANLSYGQRRSIELVRALASGYPLLLLDEPLNFLDRERRRLFTQFINDRSLCPAQIVMSSHYDEQLELHNVEVFEFEGDPPFNQLHRAVTE